MKNFKFYVSNTILTFSLAVISHFIYNWIPNSITSIFFPVNESIWEHMKLLLTPYMIDILLLYLVFQKTNIVYHNYLFSGIISSLFSIILYLVIYIPIYNVIGNYLIVDILLLFIVIFVSQFSLFNLLKKAKSYNNFALVIIIIIYIVFGYLTYNPLHNYLFYDEKNDMYGINTYVLGN